MELPDGRRNQQPREEQITLSSETITLKSEYQRGMYDAAKRILGEVIHEGNSWIMTPCDMVKVANEIMSENAPKKTPAEEFVEKYMGRMVMVDGHPYTVTGVRSLYGDVIQMETPRGSEVPARLCEITHIYEPVPYKP